MSITRSDLESGRLQQIILQSGRSPNLLSDSQLQESINNTLREHDPSSDVWIFAYGSLIWNPIFTFAEQRTGIIYGWHRRFCLWIPRGRGTPENPGLALGLDRGGSCRGVAYRIAAADVSSELFLLWRREMIVNSYIPRWVRVFDDKQNLKAIAFVINHQHRAYAGNISFETTVNSIATATGEIGSCADYLMQTVDGLLAAGIKDKPLMRLRDRIGDRGSGIGEGGAPSGELGAPTTAREWGLGAKGQRGSGIGDRGSGIGELTGRGNGDWGTQGQGKGDKGDKGEQGDAVTHRKAND